MEIQSNEQNLVEACNSASNDVVNLSKSKQMLKKYINEMGSIRDKGVAFPIDRQPPQKIHAPKAIRARPQGITHMANSKWLETSPFKNESQDTVGINQGTNQNSFQDKEDSLCVPKFQMRKLNFQNEQNFTNNESSNQQFKVQETNTNFSLTELKLRMEAEQELAAIFAKSKNKAKLGGFSTSVSNSHWSPDKNCSLSTNEFSDQQSLKDQNNQEFPLGFSKFNHFKAPIKRPKCNPILKDERFKRINIVNEGLQPQTMSCAPQGQIPCNLQAEIFPTQINEIGVQQSCHLNFTTQPDLMYGFSQEATHLVQNQGFNPYSYADFSRMNMTLNNTNLNGSVHSNNNGIWFDCPSVLPQQVPNMCPSDFAQQMQCYNAMQSQMMSMTLEMPNSAPEYDNTYMLHYQSQFQQMTPVFHNMSYTQTMGFPNYQ